MDIKDAEKIFESAPKRPLKTFLILIVFLLLVAAIAYVSGFSNEKAKKHANVKDTGPKISSPHEQKQQQNDKSIQTEFTTKINQSTDGNKSPAIISNDVVIIYGEQNDHKTNK